MRLFEIHYSWIMRSKQSLNLSYTTRYLIANIEELFRRGKASPTDVDYRTGQSYMHAICSLAGISHARGSFLLEILASLFALGAEPVSFDHQGLYENLLQFHRVDANSTRTPLEKLVEYYSVGRESGSSIEQAIQAFGINGDREVTQFKPIMRHWGQMFEVTELIAGNPHFLHGQ